jgi:predicted aspartyl protease
VKRVRLKYKFKTEPTNVGCPPYKPNTHRPVINVRLGFGGKQTPLFDALLDTGADTCCFMTQLADFLGIDWQKCPRVTFCGVGPTPTEGYVHAASVEIAGYRYDTEVIFLKDLPRPGLLGQFGFFDRFECQFDRATSSIKIYFDEENGKVVCPRST